MRCRPLSDAEAAANRRRVVDVCDNEVKVSSFSAQCSDIEMELFSGLLCGLLHSIGMREGGTQQAARLHHCTCMLSEDQGVMQP